MRVDQNKYEKTNDVNFIRDINSMAVLNIDTVGYQRFEQERARILQLQRVTNDVAILHKDVNDIKQLLQQLIDGKLNG